MKYFAALSGKNEAVAPTVTNPKRLLLSYHYFKDPQFIKEQLQRGVDVFIDSGAFSAKNSGKNVDIDEYCKHIIACTATNYAGLDVIGDPDATYQNQKYMEEKYGLHPIPTFHLGSDINDLKKIWDYDYIAFGGLVFAAGIEEHLNEAWKIIYEHNPQIKVHGFGLTNIKFIEKYPWYSIDSSSFMSARRFGRLALYHGSNNWETMSEDEFIKFLKDGYRYTDEQLQHNNTRWHLEDMFAANSMKKYVEEITIHHQYKDFSCLTHQKSLF